jgi:predicted MPP superfamily phosphohydrolase
MQVLGFLLFATVMAALLHYMVWARLLRDTKLPSPWSHIASWTMVFLASTIPIGVVVQRWAPRWFTTPWMWVAYTWLGFLFFLFVLLVPAEIARAAYLIARRPVDQERRRFLARTIGGAVGASGVGLGASGLFFALRELAVKHVTVPLAKLPASMEGFTIVQLTDVHVGPTIEKSFIDDMVEKTNALSPDLIAITGDLVDGSVATLSPHVEALGRLRAKHGVFFVTGNHEYYSGADAWIAHLTKLGIKVLRNERVAIEGIDLAGVDDAHAHRYSAAHGMDVAKALAGRDTSRLLVLLAHQPKAIADAARGGVDLQLSGHTHGGQFFPWSLLVKLDQPYLTGLHLHQATHIYVSEGTGYWGPPMRLGTRAEITRVVLRCAQG